MGVRETWPYIDSYHPIESDKHVQLKNLAVYWLVERGYSASEITDEHPIERDGQGGTAYTDIYANQDGKKAYIECETNWTGFQSLSKGGEIPARRGEPVYVFCDDGILLVEYEKPGWAFPKISNLPFLDLGAFKD